MQALLAAIRLAPEDTDAALVLGDARLQRDDPWGGLLLAAAKGQTEQWLERHADVVRARWGARRLGRVRGLITHVVCGVELPEPAAVAEEPLATLVVQVPRADDPRRLVCRFAHRGVAARRGKPGVRRLWAGARPPAAGRVGLVVGLERRPGGGAGPAAQRPRHALDALAIGPEARRAPRAGCAALGLHARRAVPGRRMNRRRVPAVRPATCMGGRWYLE